MKVNLYAIHLKKNNNRMAAGRLKGADTRIFAQYLRDLLKSYEEFHSNKLNNEALLVTVNDKEYYRQRATLEKHNILTIEDMINYITEEPIDYILIDGKPTVDKSILLTRIYVLELCSEGHRR